MQGVGAAFRRQGRGDTGSVAVCSGVFRARFNRFRKEPFGAFACFGLDQVKEIEEMGGLFGRWAYFTYIRE